MDFTYQYQNISVTVQADTEEAAQQLMVDRMVQWAQEGLELPSWTRFELVSVF